MSARKIHGTGNIWYCLGRRGKLSIFSKAMETRILAEYRTHPDLEALALSLGVSVSTLRRKALRMGIHRRNASLPMACIEA